VNFSENLMLFKDLSFRELQSIFLGSFVVIIYTFVSFLIMNYGTSNVCFQLVYLFSVFIFPGILFILNKKAFCKKEGSIDKVGRLILIINVLFLSALSVLLFFKITLESLMTVQMLFAIVYMVSFLFKAYDIPCVNHYFNKSSFDKWFMCLFVVSLCYTFSYALYAPFVKNDFAFFEGLIHLSAYYINIPFLITLLVGAIFFCWVFFSSTVKDIKAHEKLTFLVCLSPILLFDIDSNFDIEHYNAYLGPAIAVLNGKIPLVDVFCQYGLSYLVFTLGYLFLPNNYAVAAAIVSVLNIVCWITLLLIFRRMLRNPLYFSVLAIISLLGSYYLPSHTPNMIPSALSMRYLPTILLIYVLLKRLQDSENGMDRLNFLRVDVFNGIVLLSILWNFDTLISLFILYGAYLWIIESRWKFFFRKLGILFFSIITIYIAVSVVYGVCFHNIPSYWLYLKYIYAYMNPSTKIGGIFLLGKIDLYRNFFFWMVFAIMNLVLFFYTIYYRFCQKMEDPYIKMLFFLNTACITFMAYFTLKPSLLSMMTSGYLSFIVLFSILVMEKEKTKRFELKIGSSFLLLMVTFLFFSMIAKTFFSERKDTYRNGDMLYAIVHEEKSPFNLFFYNLTHFCSDKKPSAGAGPDFAYEENTCTKNAYHAEFRDVIEKWYPKKKEVLLFHRDMIEVLMDYKKVHTLLVNPGNDSLVADLNTRTMAEVKDKIHEGDIIVVEKNLDVLPIELKVLLEISKFYSFKFLEETPHLNVFELINKTSNPQSDLSLPLTVRGYGTSFDDAFKQANPDARFLVPALFDHDKETTLFFEQSLLRNLDVLWIAMDFGKLFWIDDIKIWRRIDFRKPDYAKTEAFGFLHHFNIALSEDNKQWFIVASEQGFDIESQYFYEAKFNPFKARYVRLSIFSEDLKYFSISQIEVFGKK
jgi:hypothetical protein